MPQFSKDYDRIDEIKGNDAFLVEDSSDGKVKFANPSQINARFDKLVADIEAATRAAATATTKASSAAVSANEAKTSENNAQAHKTAAANSAEAARQSAEAAAGTLASAAQKGGPEMRVIVEALNQAHSRIETLENLLVQVLTGQVIIPRLSVDELDVWKRNNIVTHGAGAPTYIPLDKGRLYIDTEGDVIYKSTGNTSVGSWSNK